MSLVGYVLLLQLVFFTVGVTLKIQIGALIAGNAGEELKLPCQLPGDHSNVNVVQVVWLKQASPKAETLAVYNPIFGTNYPTTPGRITFHNKSSQDCFLRINPLELADEGIYSCEVNVFPTGTHESHINLTVLVKPTIEVVAVPADTRMAEAPVATCTAANGKPAADITWMAKVPGTVTSRLTHYPNRTITITSQYRIAPSRKANRETLTCLVSHKALRDRVSSVVTLSVQYPPEVSITGYDGNWHINRRNVSLNCIAEANPPATAYHWTMTKGPGSETARAVGKHLYIEQVDHSVNGTWVCEATNVFGKGKGEVTVVVSEVDSLSAGTPFRSTIVYVATGTVVGILFVTAFVSYVIVKKRQRTEDTKAETKPPPAKRNHITVFATLNLNVLDSLNLTRRENCEREATVNADVHIN